MSDGSRYYTVRWPKGSDHETRSVSGVIAESNVQGQVALHFYNETRALEEEIRYDEDGNRVGEGSEIAYERELVQTVLVSDSAARKLRDVLNALFPEPGRDELH